MQQEETNKKNSWVKEFVSYILWLGGMWILIQVFVQYIGVFSVVEGSSMEPTLCDGECLWIDELSYYLGEPERFDVVVFPVKSDGVTEYFIKRIIGMPGETIYIDENGDIYVDDELLEEDYGKETILSYNRLRAAMPVTLGEDEYFVLGDNRNHSTDSRSDIVGNVHESEFIGKAAFCFWPLDRIGVVK